MTWLDSENHYGLVSRVIHWLMAAVLVFMLLSEWWMEALEHIAGLSGMAIHQGTGLALAALLGVRLVWRLINRGRVQPTQSWKLAARIGHLALYGLMLIIPLTGFLAAWGSGHGVDFFGLHLISPGPEMEWLEDGGEEAHEFTTTLFWFVIAGHVAAALFHQHVKGDGTLRKMA
ncbi:cytochrome B [Marinobacter salinus]|uniref:Cytochrome B n=1 Tax=Marinobacter salinus TaxID=1874317 RepID=A0A1D9GLR0_9GAMM|nr:cytochrome b [Marinobacter salinus]AOY88577.1 cytochrome B [Marinobacter salinus]